MASAFRNAASLLRMDLPRLLILGQHDSFDSQLSTLEDRVGFTALKIKTDRELVEVLKDESEIVGVLNFGASHLLIPDGIKCKAPLKVAQNENVTDILSKLYHYLNDSIPGRLITLQRNVIQYIYPKIFGGPIGPLTESLDFSLPFSECVSCESVSQDINIKMLIEMNSSAFERNNTPFQSVDLLMDSFGEFCNQSLGVINFRLKEIGIKALMCLPLKITLGNKTQLAEAKFAPPFRLLNAGKSLAISTIIDIYPSSVNWEKLSTDPVFDDSEYFINDSSTKP